MYATNNNDVVGCVEELIMHPLDLIKTRFQLQSSSLSPSDPHHYSGVRDCMAKMYKQEGLRSFWKGLLPPVMVETPKRAWKVRYIIIYPFTNNYTVNIRYVTRNGQLRS